MEIKTTEQILQENSNIVEKIMEEEPHIELYDGEFDKTYLKKWVSVESEKIRSEKLRKDIQWWLQRHINKEILNFKKEFEGLKK